MKIISIREQPEYAQQAIIYFQEKWASDITKKLYQDAIIRAIHAENPLPQWYILVVDDTIIGCAGLITNDFISRCELYPWLCSLYIDQEHRRQGFATEVIQHISQQTKLLGFNKLHLCTDLKGFYEKSGFILNGLGYHLDGSYSYVYSKKL